MTENDITKGSTYNGYGLGRNLAASLRLDAQHHCFKDLLGYNISPQIPTTLGGKDLAIADIGAGTGVWLTEVSLELPNARLDGFDNSTDQFPPEAWWPPNVTFQQLDALKPFFKDLHGKYDIVNIRLFVCVILDGDPKPLLENIVLILKPGGYLQWTEHDPSTARIESAHSNNKRKAYNALLGSLKWPTSSDWVNQLPTHFENAGFTSVRNSIYPIPPVLRTPFTRVNLFGSEEISYVMYDNSSPESPGPRRRVLIQEALQETKNGVCMVWSPEVVLGRKASG